MLRELAHIQTHMHNKLNGLAFQHSVCVHMCLFIYVCVCVCVCNSLNVRVGVGLDLQLSHMLDFRETETAGKYSKFPLAF
jgi:hypothetical protein